MATKKDLLLDDLVTCSVCIENYNDPRTLPCGHSFCLGCLKTILSGGRKVFKCPVCRAHTRVPRGGVGQFKTAFLINSLKDAMKRTEEEKSECQLYCEDCQQLLTYELAAMSHKNHKYRKVQESYADHFARFQQSLSYLKRRKKDVANQRHILIEVESEINKQKDKVKESIVRFSESIINLIKTATARKLNQADEIFDKKIQIVSEQRKESDTVLDSLGSFEEWLEPKLRDDTHCQLLSKKQEISQQIHSMIPKSELDFKPKEKADVVFMENFSLAASCPKLGYLMLDDKQLYSVRHDGVVMAGTPSTVTLFMSPSQCRGPPFDPPPPIKCTLTSCDTGTTTLCNIGRRCNSSYTFEITPIDRGKQELSIAADDTGLPPNSYTFMSHPSPFMRGKPLKVMASNKPTGIAVTSKGMLIVVNQGSRYLSFIGGSCEERPSHFNTFNNPHGIALSDDEKRIVITDKHRVQLLHLYGGLIASVGRLEQKEENGPFDNTMGSLFKNPMGSLFKNPMGVAIHPETKQIYVADSGNDRVVILNGHDLRYHSELKGFNEPADVAFSSGKLYILNRRSSCIDIYSANGHRSISQMGTGPGLFTRNEDLNCPSSLAIDSFGYIYVTEVSAEFFSWTLKRCENSRISIYKTDGTLVRNFGSKGTKVGCFQNPCGIAINHKDGSLYVCDTDNDRIITL